MQPEALREAGDWLTRAERDLLVAERALQGQPPLLEQTAYHAQQAAEKALKALLAAHDRPFPKTHNLERLVAWCAEIDPDFARFAATAYTLNPYATQFRYPGGPLEPELADAQAAIRLAAEIVGFVRQRLTIVGLP